MVSAHWEQKQTLHRNEEKTLLTRPDPRLIPGNSERLLSLHGWSALVSRIRCDGCKRSRLQVTVDLFADIRNESKRCLRIFFFLGARSPVRGSHAPRCWLTPQRYMGANEGRVDADASRQDTHTVSRRRRDLLKTRQPPFRSLHISCPASPFLFSPPVAIFSALLFTPQGGRLGRLKQGVSERASEGLSVLPGSSWATCWKAGCKFNMS